LDGTGKSLGGCLWRMDGVDKILAGYVLPLLVLSLLLIIGIMVRLCSRTSSSSPPSSPRHHSLPSITVEDDGEDDGNNTNEKKGRCIGPAGWLRVPDWRVGILTLGLLSYSVIVKSTLSLLRCVPEPHFDSSDLLPSSQRLVMFMAGHIACYNHYYHYIAFALLPFILAFPIIIGRLARPSRATSSNESYKSQAVVAAPRPFSPLARHDMNHDNDFTDTSGVHAITRGGDIPTSVSNVLTIAYRPICWWGEAIQLGRRITLVSVATFIHQPIVRSLTLSLLLVLYCICHAAIRPYRIMIVNYLEGILMMILTCVSMLHVIHLTQLYDGAVGNDTTIEWTQAILVIIPLIFAFVFICHAVCRACCNGDDHTNNDDAPSVQRPSSPHDHHQLSLPFIHDDVKRA
jgi:hypothetical protein